MHTANNGCGNWNHLGFFKTVVGEAKRGMEWFWVRIKIGKEVQETTKRDFIRTFVTPCKAVRVISDINGAIPITLGDKLKNRTRFRWDDHKENLSLIIIIQTPFWGAQWTI